MATKCKLYRGEMPQMIPPNTWTLVTYERALSDDLGMAAGTPLSLIVPECDGYFVWARNLRWASITVPAGDERDRQFMSRFVRDPLNAPDDTGAADKADTPGKDWQTVTWLFDGNAGEPVGVQVWHDHTEPVALEHAQFAGVTWDY